MQQQTHSVNPQTIPGFIRCISGLFITKDNPHGLTPVEMMFLSKLISILQQQNKQTIDKDVKIELANVTNQGLQVVLNYLTRLRKKGVVEGDKLHQIFKNRRIIIEMKA
jgi:hypothetical protein